MVGAGNVKDGVIINYINIMWPYVSPGILFVLGYVLVGVFKDIFREG